MGELRYTRNKELISDEEQMKLAGSKVAVVGLGGLGGHVSEQLARLGVGNLVLIDTDKVDESNLNRQLFATESAVGQDKTLAARDRLMKVNSKVNYSFHSEYLDEKNAAALLSGVDVVVDAVDNIPTRFVLQKICSELHIPMVHGSIGGWYGQVSFIYPGDDTLDLIYTDKQGAGVEKKLGNPAFTPALVASLEVAETLKYLLNKGELLRGKMLFIDLMMQDYMVIQLK
ncbi:MAG: ThiF family adenylyltransferase [Sedimentibacter sp.]|uniref:HesA/MoeB/ThiF family protein n=1 Tax=Sedimentibacter sp. TaxID=1960295 RepID=UPI003158508F